MTGRRSLAAAGGVALMLAVPSTSAGQADPGAAPAATTAPSDASVAKGRALFKRHCLGCHGEAGKGDGAAAKFLQGKLPDLSDKATLADRSDAVVHDVIAKGKKTEIGTMPPFESRLKEPDIVDLINFVRSLSR